MEILYLPAFPSQWNGHTLGLHTERLEPLFTIDHIRILSIGCAHASGTGQTLGWCLRVLLAFIVLEETNTVCIRDNFFTAIGKEMIDSFL